MNFIRARTCTNLSAQKNESELPSKLKTLGFAVLIIFGIGGLMFACIGTGGLLHAGSLTNLGQVNSCIMIAIGGGGGIPLLVIGIIGFHTCSGSKRMVNQRTSVQDIQYSTVEDPKDEVGKFVLSVKRGTSIPRALQTIPKSFFENKTPRFAKQVFSKIMRDLFNAQVFFPKAGPCNPSEIHLNSILNLDLNVFQLSTTNGVQFDIPNSSKDKQHVHVYQVASQYNAAEAPDRFTPAIGEAMRTSEFDPTQGPLAQRTNPEVFECVTAFLTHLGFNMLQEVLPSAGQTYQKGASIEHGYLCPTKETIGTLTQEFKDNFSEAEYVCYSSFSAEWRGSEPVYIMLQSAPAIGYSNIANFASKDLQRYAALANYLAFFRQGIAIAKWSGKPVVLHATAIGGGVFKNHEDNLTWGFTKAALELQKEMSNWQVSVQLEANQGRGPLKRIADRLGIQKKDRIGDIKKK